jgi:cyclopropane-fatty-acyl-phospholipid synthase
MQKMTKGQLRVLTSSHNYTFPPCTLAAKPDLMAEVRVVNDIFWVRLCTMSDLGFAEAYMYGEVECDDLASLFRVSAMI